MLKWHTTATAKFPETPVVSSATKSATREVSTKIKKKNTRSQLEQQEAATYTAKSSILLPLKLQSFSGERILRFEMTTERTTGCCC